MLGSVESALGWDERTMLPAAGGEYRAEQMAALAGLSHQSATNPQYGEWLEALTHSPLAGDPASDSGVTVRRLKRTYDKKVRLPRELVEELTRATVLGQQAWQEARQASDYLAFRPYLERILHLKQQEAEALGYPDTPYDALLDDYEPEMRTSEVSQILSRLREDLVPLVAEILDSPRRPDATILTREYPVDAQESLGRYAAEKIGFDFRRGRLDVTAHPFCTTLGPHDCRITTRYNARHFNEALFGILHEAGHGIYEQGLRTDQFGLPLGEAASLGIHESQSRLWENIVGRSLDFWRYFYPQAQQRFPAALADVAIDDFYFAINDVRASLVRIEADEATYNLHILIRFELETALLKGDLPVADLPGVWNETYRRYLGIVPDRDSEGVLQDVHWSAGLIGYFPTYALGNLCAAQLFARADAELGGLSQMFAQGEFAALRAWLREKVHSQGRRYSAIQLVEHVTGQPLSHGPLVSYLRNKLGSLYGLSKS